VEGRPAPKSPGRMPLRCAGGVEPGSHEARAAITVVAPLDTVARIGAPAMALRPTGRAATGRAQNEATVVAIVGGLLDTNTHIPSYPRVSAP
jgi:hypothetical protein